MLGLGIPFNKPHRFKVIKIDENGLEAMVPYRRKNLNHLKGIHACALATVSELASGLSLMNCLSAPNYRLIMKSMHMDYHYQAKTDVVVKGSLGKEQFEKEILTPLQQDGVAFYTSTIPAHDTKGNHICTATVEWQIKDWAKVKTKV